MYILNSAFLSAQFLSIITHNPPLELLLIGAIVDIADRGIEEPVGRESKFFSLPEVDQ